MPFYTLLTLHAARDRQFEVLEEIQLSERSRRRDLLVREGHTMDSFSQQQLTNYIEVRAQTRWPDPERVLQLS